MNEVHISQGGALRIDSSELDIINSIFESMSIEKSTINFEQSIVTFPQAYVGYISLPSRKIVIDPKHEGVNFQHILRIYRFLYASDLGDLNEPIYDIDEDISTYDIVENFVYEVDTIIKKGLPVEYKSCHGAISHLRGTANLVNTALNRKCGKKEIFDCKYDELSHDVPINQVIYKAILKISKLKDSGLISKIKGYFYDVTELVRIPTEVQINSNTKYCKKALTLAYMILNELNISNYGEDSYGQNLLINFDRTFENFVKKILTVYSEDYNFTYWDNEKRYALCKTSEKEFFKSYNPDMLYRYQEQEYPISAFCILDMKNKTALPFSNADVYQMFFYASQLHSRKVILCYPSSSNQANAVLNFDNEDFVLRKIFAVFINIAGNTATEFKSNIHEFIKKIKALL